MNSGQSIVDYVRQKYPDSLEEIERDPFQWILKRTTYIVGYDRIKVLILLSIVSSQLLRERLHVMLVGEPGTGKLTTAESVLQFMKSSDRYIFWTRLDALDLDTYDGKVVFVDYIDGRNVDYLKYMMTNDGVCRTDGRAIKCTPGQAVFVATSVSDMDKEIFNRFLRVYVNWKALDREKVWRAILNRKPSEIDEVDELVFMAYLSTRPNHADTKPTLDRAKEFVSSLQEYTHEPLLHVAEVLRKLTVTVAVARGKTETEEEDFQFVVDNFKLDVLYNGLGLTKGDVEIIELLDDGLKTNDIADKLRASKRYTVRMLRGLKRKGVIERDGKTWRLSELGLEFKSLLGRQDT